MDVIEIKGEVVPFKIQEWELDYGDYVNTDSIKNQLKNVSGDIEVHINSRGGDVDEGFMIYNELRRYAKDNNAKVTTKAVGRCDSIAISIFLAGDKRIANRFLEPFVHNPYFYIFDEADKNVLKRAYDDISNYTNRIAKHYEEHTKLSIEEATELMDNDTYISPDEMVSLGFATEIEEVLRPVALNKKIQKINSKTTNKVTNKNKNEMTNKEKSMLRKLADAFNLNAKNLVEINTSTGSVLEFPDLEDDATPKVGDKATVDGKAADGEYTLPNGDVYVFDNGELKEIREEEDGSNLTDGEVEEEIEDLGDDVEKLEDKVKDLEEELEEVKEALNKSNKTISNLKKEHDSKWKALKGVVSDYTKDVGKENNSKNNAQRKDSKGLSGAIKNLNKK